MAERPFNIGLSTEKAASKAASQQAASGRAADHAQAARKAACSANSRHRHSFAISP